jgi:hypothetical protein
MEVLMKRNTMIGDVVNLLLAVWLFLSPWIVGFVGVMPAAWAAWLSAIAIGIFAIAALAAMAEWEEWINLALGIWVLISPWVLGFSTTQPPTTALSLTGLAVAVIAAIEILVLHCAPPPRTTSA